VDGCTFADYRGIKMYAEGGAKTTDLTVKNTDFSAVDNKPAIVLTYGESVTLEGNTYSDTGVFELDLDGAPNGTTVTSNVAPTCKNDNGACGVLVDGKIYTTVAQAAEVATSGSQVTLLHNSTEIVELPEGVVLDKNNFEAAGVTVKIPYVAQVGDVKYATLAEAAAAAVAGDEIVLIADAYIAEGTDVTIPDGVILNGNGYSIYASGADYNTSTSYGYVVAGGNLTIKGVTKIEKFSAGYYDHIITIGEGASLQVFGVNRVSLGYGSSFDITGSIVDAKTTDKATVTPSLVISAGISIVGSNDTYLKATNAYVVLGSTTSKNSNAGGTFDITFDNCIVEFTNQLTTSTPKYTSLNPAFNITFEDSTVTSATKFCLMATGSNVVVDNSDVTLGTYLHNSGNIEIKNGSTFVGSMIQYGENGGNSGTITVDNASLTIKNNNSAYAMDGKDTGKLVLKNGATASVDYVKATEIAISAGAELTTKSSELTVNTEPGYEAEYVDGKYVAVQAPVAQIGETKYYSLAEALAAAQNGDTVTLLNDVVLTAGITVSGKSITFDGNGYSISGKADANYGYQAVYFYNAGETTIKNVTFKNFAQSNVSAVVLRLECSDKFILEDVYFDNCDVAKGTDTTYSVMRVYDTDFTATNLNITNCKGAMLMDIGPSSNDFAGLIVIKDSKFENNTVIGTALIYPTLEPVENSYLYVYNTQFLNNEIGDKNSSTPQGRGVIHLSSDAVIENCVFDGNDVYGSHANNISYGVNLYSGYDLTVKGCTFKNSAVYQTNEKVGPVAGAAVMSVGEAVLENNTVEANNSFYHRADVNAEYVAKEVASVGTYSDSYGDTIILSGTYNGKLISYTAGQGFAVKGGTYNMAVPEAYCAEGFVCEANGDGTYGIKSTYIEVSTWEELVNAIADKNITDIKLIADITANGRLVVDRDLHIDLGENTLYLTQTNNRVWKASTLTIDGNGVINVSAVNGGNVFYVGSAETGAGTSGNLVLNNIEVFGENYNTGTNAAVFMLYGPAPSTLTITNCELNLKNNQGNGSVFYDTGTNNQCKINIVDSELNFDGTVRGSVCGDITIDNSIVVIKNCDNGFNEATLTIK
ncbi:MAG: hypothetical protein IKA02_00060, partial [Clostridia bacterium]|nr:hypothetical protein [Clostridia bacterium]